MNISTRIVVFLALFAPVVAGDSNAQLTKVTTSYVSDSAAVLPLWLGKEAGIFARNGLDVQPVRVHAAVGVMALLSGELQFVMAAGPVVVDRILSIIAFSKNWMTAASSMIFTKASRIKTLHVDGERIEVRDMGQTHRSAPTVGADLRVRPEVLERC